MEKITVRYYIVCWVVVWLALLSLRFYIFYMMVAAVARQFRDRDESHGCAEFYAALRRDRA